MRYINYEEYIDLGGEMTEKDFARFGFSAESKLNMITRNRVFKDFSTGGNLVYEESLKRLMLELCDLCKELSSASKSKVASQSNQGMSKSYESASKSDIEASIYDACSTYLGSYRDLNDVPLMYMGVC